MGRLSRVKDGATEAEESCVPDSETDSHRSACNVDTTVDFTTLPTYQTAYHP